MAHAMGPEPRSGRELTGAIDGIHGALHIAKVGEDCIPAWLS